MKKLFCLIIAMTMLFSGIACNVIYSRVSMAEGEATTPPTIIISAESLVVPANTKNDNDASSETMDATEAGQTINEASEPTQTAVITYSDYRLVPFTGAELPEYYFCVTNESYPFTLCVFIDEDGESQWRIFAEQDVFADGELAETINGFLKCHVNSAVIRFIGEPSYKFEAFGDLGFVNYDEEKFGVASLYVYDTEENETAPYTNVLYATYDKVPADESAYSYMYPAVNGVLAPGAIPVQIDDELNLWYIVPGGDKIFVGQCELPIVE